MIKEKTKNEKKREINKPSDAEESSRAEDRERRGYYYDDAHGYETYNPDEEEELKD